MPTATPMDTWIAAEKELILANESQATDLLADHWDLHPDKVGRLIAAAANGDANRRQAARQELEKLLDQLADTEACERFHASHRERNADACTLAKPH